MIDIVNELFQPKVSLSVEGVRRVMDSFLDDEFRETYLTDTFIGLLTGKKEIVECVVNKMLNNTKLYEDLGATQYGYNHDESNVLLALNIDELAITGISEKYLAFFEKIVESESSNEVQLKAVKEFISKVYADEDYDTNTKIFLLTHLLRELVKYIISTCSMAMHAQTSSDTKLN